MKSLDPTVSVVLPCRDEANHVEAVVASIPGAYEVVCIDNNSRDLTGSVLRLLCKTRPNMIVLSEPRQEDGVGYGYACKKGMDQATAGYVACADADGTYPVEDIPAMVEYMGMHNIDALFCSRYPAVKESIYSKRAWLGTVLLGRLAQLRHGIYFRDIVSGMWIIKADSYRKLDVRQGGWNFSLEIKIASALHPDVVCAQYPIVQRKRYGVSKQTHMRTGLMHAWWLLRYHPNWAMRRTR